MGYSDDKLTCDVKGCVASLTITPSFHPEHLCGPEDRSLGDGWRTEKPLIIYGTRGSRWQWKVLCPQHRASDLSHPAPAADEWSAERFGQYRDGMIEGDLQRERNYERSDTYRGNVIGTTSGLSPRGRR